MPKYDYKCKKCKNTYDVFDFLPLYEIRNVKGKIKLSYICWVTKELTVRTITNPKTYNYIYLKYLGEV